MKIIFQIVDRLKKLRGYKTDGEIADALKTTKTALSNHKARDTVPYEAIVSFCERENISLDWLLTGEGPKYRGTGTYPQASPAPGQVSAPQAEYDDPKTPLEAAFLKMFRGLSPIHKGDAVGFVEDLRLAEAIPPRETKKGSAAQ